MGNRSTRNYSTHCRIVARILEFPVGPIFTPAGIVRPSQEIYFWPVKNIPKNSPRLFFCDPGWSLFVPGLTCPHTCPHAFPHPGYLHLIVAVLMSSSL